MARDRLPVGDTGAKWGPLGDALAVDSVGVSAASLPPTDGPGQRFGR